MIAAMAAPMIISRRVMRATRRRHSGWGPALCCGSIEGGGVRVSLIMQREPREGVEQFPLIRFSHSTASSSVIAWVS